jgi:hypothetical protein
MEASSVIMHTLLLSTISASLYCKYCVDETSLLYNPQSEGQYYERRLRREYLQRIKIISRGHEIICFEGCTIFEYT